VRLWYVFLLVNFRRILYGSMMGIMSLDYVRMMKCF
jgi:hypothetical protein